VGQVSATVVIAAPLAEVWDFYFEPRNWPAWVDQFRSVETSDGYPEQGGSLRWRSGSAGRGTVTERVLAHEPRSLHRVAFTDPESEGELEVSFEIEPGAEAPSTRVSQATSYRLTGAGLLGGITDALFVRSQVRGSLARSLARLRLEVEALDKAQQSG
jgi:uncharacterized membrane protein